MTSTTSPSSQTWALGRWRLDLLVVAAATLLYVWATTPPGAYFLHVDAADQDFAAIGLARNCWEYSTEKMVGVLLLAPFFRLFGPSTVWETVLLALLAAVSVATVYELGRLLGRSRLAGLLAALLLMSLPTFQYFSRTQIGYVMPCLLLAWLAVYHKRWGWAGFLFCLTLIAHFGYVVIVGVSVLALAALYLRPATWRDWLRFSLAGIAPWLAIELLFFAYMGRPFQWTRGTLAAGLGWSGVSNEISATYNWPWAFTTILGSNGWVLSALLALSLLAPLAWRKDSAALALWLSGLISPLIYTLAALRHETFISRPLAPLYPLWAIGAAAAFQELLRRLPQRRLQQALSALAVVGLTVAAVGAGLFIHEFTQTPYASVQAWFQRAAAAGRPVRYNNYWVSLYYAQEYHVEVLTADSDWIKADQPGQAVLIFEGKAPQNLSRDGYTIEKADVSATADARYPVLTREAILPRHAELWWPSGPSQSVKPTGPLPPVALYYSGSGCVTPPAYGNHTLHFYQLVWQRLTRGKSQ